ncbi:MAG: tubulin-like doman-containing protein [Polyangiaceae bacterium]
MKIPPHVFIGLGGCGSKIVNEIARKLKRRKDEYTRYRDLVHFFAFDTDQHELKQAESVDVRVPISSFDKRSYVAHAFGQRGAPEDPLLTAWWPEYYLPRDVAGAGAGQIRIESRLSVHFTLKFKPEVFTSLEHAVGRSFAIDTRFRDADKAPMVHIYASLAGGTGSGAFLSLAYIVHDLFREHSRPLTVGTFVLPAVFRRAGLPNQQLDKIMANGYAALLELEHLQAATESEAVEFQYDPRAKDRQLVKRRAFDQVYLVDDIGAGREVITDTRQVYQAIADSAYSQIFSDILGRQASTADNDEREMGVTDHQMYTKRYGSFGLAVLNVPDEDILGYCANRYAVEALTRTFALPVEPPPERESHADREKREQDFVRSLLEQANLPEETGAFYRRIVDGCDGTGAEQGAVDRFLRYFETDFAARIQRHVVLPRWTEEKLLEYDEDAESVRIEMPKRLEQWNKAADDARTNIDQEASFIANEVNGGQHEHSFGKLLADSGPIFERLFLIRIAAALRQRQAAARAKETTANELLKPLANSYLSWAERLSDAAPKTVIEYVRGNDYGQEVVPEFMGWYRANMETPQLEKLINAGIVDLCEDLLRSIDERKARLGTLFSELFAIRDKLTASCDELIRFGVRRDDGGLSNEHVLDVELYQNFEDPAGLRMWNWVFERRENAATDYDPAKIFPAVQVAYASVEHARHMSAAVSESLVEMGRSVWRERILGMDEPRGLDEMGLEVRSALQEEAQLALGWAKLRKHHADPLSFHYRDHRQEWELVTETLSAADIDDYIQHKIHHAAKKCAPFLRLKREERATAIEPKRYVVLHNSYLDDAKLRHWLLENERFPVKGGDVLRTEDAKRVTFYWSEMGMPLYRIESMDDYYDRYHHVKRDELSRGKVYRWADMPLQPKHAAAHAEHCEGRRVPDIPLHIDKRWEAAPDEHQCLADIAPKAVVAGEGRMAWLEKRDRVQTARSAEELVHFVWAQVHGLVVQPEGAEMRFANDDIPERDRTLGKFRDVAFDRFRQTKLAIREWFIGEIDHKNSAFIENRDREAASALVGDHIEHLKKLRLQLEGKEHTFVEAELAAAAQALETLLAKM